MDSINMGNVIRRLRRERGLGCPDLGILAGLSQALGADLTALLTGNLPEEERSGGSMKNATYYVCPICGAITMTTVQGELSCCGRRLAPLTPQKASEEEKLRIEKVEDEWFVTTDHPMSKAHHIALVAFAAGDRVDLRRCYPEWDLQLRFPSCDHGKLLWYCTEHGLFYQYI